MLSWLMRHTSTSAPVVVVHRTRGGLYVVFESETLPEDPTVSFLRALPTPKGGAIFLPSSASWTTRFWVRTLLLLTRRMLFVELADGVGQSSDTRTSPDLSESSDVTA